MRPCLVALQELADSYKCSIVLCTATQPALTRREDFQHGLLGVREIISHPPELASELRRVEVMALGKVSDNDLAERLQGENQVLCIVSTRGHARRLFEMVPDKCGTFHLSALMCPAHRRIVLRNMRSALKKGLPCLTISTQLVEAGVDIDFPVVYRSLAGLDSVAQAAGRCNREGLLKGRGQVFIFEPEEGITAYFRQTAQTAQAVMHRFPDDFMTLEAIEEYFRDLYWLQNERLDSENILGRLAADLKNGNFPFREVAEVFQIIQDGMQPVVIPWNKRARKLIAELPYVKSPGSILRKLQL